MTTIVGKFTTLRASDGVSFRAYVGLPPAGKGPGLLVLHDVLGVNADVRARCDELAEEGYVVVAPDLFARVAGDVELGSGPADIEKGAALHARLDDDRALHDTRDALAALRKMPEVTEKIGVVGHGLGGGIAIGVAARHPIDAAASVCPLDLERRLDDVAHARCPLAVHAGELDEHTPPALIDQVRARMAASPGARLYVYPGAGHAFASRGRAAYDKPAAKMAYSRSLALLRKTLGPEYDLSALWDKHLEHEFASRDLEANMTTMVANPYVNDIPTLTGGVGQEELRHFYQHHFLFANPDDTAIVPISRTVGADRVVDEFIFRFTHTREMDWMLPGVAPTGKYVEVPMVAIVCFRGDKLFHEHIYWDQASVLVQLGLLDRRGLPVAGVESARKLVDETLPSNELMTRCSYRQTRDGRDGGEAKRE